MATKLSNRAVLIAFIALGAPFTAFAGPDPLCDPLREFVKSVPREETRSLEFHTLWGANFEGAPEPAIFAKRCNHHGYATAMAVCAYFMEHGAVEFSDNNLKRAATCLSPKTRIDASVSLHDTSMSLEYGNDDRGSTVTLAYLEDPQLGGMVLKVVADGY